MVKQCIRELLGNLRFFYIRHVKKPNIKIMTLQSTLDYVYYNNASLIRYGDGEMALIRNKNLDFQPLSKNLNKYLKEILGKGDEKLLIAIPDIFNDLRALSTRSQKFFKINMGTSFLAWKKYLRNDYYYGNSFVSRIYGTYENNYIYLVKYWKRIWYNKDVVLIEGEYSRNGVGNDLFDNVKTIQRILCPNINAFSCVETIIDCISTLDINKLLLVSLGPTAKVICYELYKKGYRCIDIGNLDMVYSNYLQNETVSSEVKGKLIIEAGNYGGQNLELNEADRIKYEKEVINIIKPLRK